MTDSNERAGSQWWERWNPLCCDGFSLTPNQLVAAKLLALYWIEYRLRWGFSAPFLPWVSPLDAPQLAAIWSPLLLFFYVAATIALCLNRAPRTAAAICSAVIFLQLASGRHHYSNSTIFTGLLLGLLALQTRERGAWMIRTQLVLMYSGAAINKLLHPDWQSGQYILFWTRDVMQIDWFTALADASGGSLYVGLSWVVIASEFAMAGIVAAPRLLPLAAMLALVFHGGMLMFTEGRISWVFAYAVFTAFVTLWRWPEPLVRPGWAGLRTGPGRMLSRFVWPGSEAPPHASSRATPFWRWPVFYLGLFAVFHVAERFLRTAKETVPRIDLF